MKSNVISKETQVRMQLFRGLLTIDPMLYLVACMRSPRCGLHACISFSICIISCFSICVCIRISCLCW